MTTTILTTASTGPATSKMTAKESSGEYEKQIVAFVLQTLYTYDEEVALKDAEDYIKKAEELSENNYGAILDENGAIEIARSVLLEEKGKDYIDELESDFVEVDGIQMGYQRYSPPYKATYYDDYDAWMVIVTGICGVRDDGVKFAVPASDEFVVMRGSDGKVIAVF